MNYTETVQKTSLPAIVEMFSVTTSTGTLRFVTGPRDGKPVVHAGKTYTPLPIDVSGFGFNTTGSIPRPTMRISNIDSALIPVIAETDDLIGARVVRQRIFATNLDGEPDEDPGQTFPPDIYVVNRKSVQTRASVEWELVAAIDQEGVKLPRRQVIRDYCQSIYRVYDAGEAEFDYGDATCPYTGVVCFNAQGKSTDAASDACGKTLADCKKRFGEHGILPFDGFPGVARVRKS
ncbi:Phage minor tail protein L [Vibrio aerogenes CECT 7868]|uniref:Phage minor tail protein L n=1 Tax=Vibrio aerogenes CECT 7868 TaxID=1216006 RepID=A0A1M6C163_9VIBR|nr:phage minor tail protein L [Vibrio aerogenes]SHI54775.1 Phage minor tail protein L [Vibrio aerogenes CECT 7868]